MLKVRGDADVSEVDGSIVVMLESGDLAVLNESASYLFNATNSLGAEGIAAYSNRYGISQEEAKSDFKLLEEELAEYGLLEE